MSSIIKFLLLLYPLVQHVLYDYGFIGPLIRSIIETIANDITEYTATIATIANSRGIYCAIETIANDITEYTATNIISITDGFIISSSFIYFLLN